MYTAITTPVNHTNPLIFIILTLYTAHQQTREYDYLCIMLQSINNLNILIVLTSPGKKQQCFLSMCLPNVICNKLSLMWRVSIISDSQAKGWLLRADSLRGIFALIDWNLCNIWFCKRWNVELRIPLQIVLNCRLTWNRILYKLQI